MKILVYGVGGIGGYIGALLKKTKLDITFICRGKRFDYLKSHGLSLQSLLGDLKFKNLDIRKELKFGEKFDIIINSVKLYDFDNVLEDLIKNVSGDFIILPFQNGVYAEEKIKKDFGSFRTTGAVAQISSYIDDNNTVKHIGKLATFFVGPYTQINSSKLQEFCKSCQEVGLDMRFKENIKEKIWDKFIFLSAYSGITTLTRKSIGEIFDDKKLREKFISAMNETFNLSKYFGVKFKNNPVDLWLEKISNMPYEMTSSMYLDYKKKKN